MQAPSRMPDSTTTFPFKNQALSLAQHILVPGILLVTIIFFFPPRANFEISADEGMNLMKAMLVERGYPLYQEVWSDQPPLFTYLLVPVIRVFGNNVDIARFLVLSLTGVLLWAAFQVMRLVWGSGAAFAGSFLIFLLPYFLVLSFSVMIGLPAITLAMLSLLALLQWHAKRRPVWLVASAGLLGLSVLIKLITGFLVIIFVLGILITQYQEFKGDRRWRNLLMPPLIWMFVFVGVVVPLILVLSGTGNIGQLISTHLRAEQVIDFRTQVQSTLSFHVQSIRPLFILTVVGIILAIRSRRWLSLYLVAWFITTLVLLIFHRPVWWHQTLLLTIPAAMLAGLALNEVLNTLIQAAFPNSHINLNGLLLTAALLGIMVLLFIFRPNESIQMINLSPKTFGTEPEIRPHPAIVYRRMKSLAPQTNWVVTDMPIFAFRIGVPVPPELAVFSVKRVETGDLVAEEILAVVREYQPEQIMFGRFHFPELTDELLVDYDLDYIDDEMELYIRKGLLK